MLISKKASALAAITAIPTRGIKRWIGRDDRSGVGNGSPSTKRRLMKQSGRGLAHRLAPRAAIPLAVTGGLLAGASTAAASIPDGSGVIHACYTTTPSLLNPFAPWGSLRVIDTVSGQACAGNESPLSWSQTGSQGPAGPTSRSRWSVVRLIPASTASETRNGLASKRSRTSVMIGLSLSDPEQSVHTMQRHVDVSFHPSGS